MTDANKLLLDFARHGSEPAFRELVTRYLGLVYSVALRRTQGDAHLAEDISQSVFTDLARKAPTLPPNIMLGGWLHRHTNFVAATALRAEHRRQNRERQAAEMNSLNAAPDNLWLQLGPVLDEAIDQLESADREAIVLRYFEQQDLRTVGAALGIGEDAAQKRVSRAVDKLRELVGQRGATLSVTILMAALASGAVSAAPAGLANKISAAALTSAGATVGAVGGILAFLAAAKIKLALAAAVLAMVAVPLWLYRADRTQPNATKAGGLSNEVAAADLVASKSGGGSSDEKESAAPMAMPKGSGLLRLKILTADSGQPVPMVPIDYRRWDGDKFTGRKLHSTRFGNCEVDFSRETTTELELTTRVDGFADTRLHWRQDRGDTIPEEYTLRLDRAVPIGGTVVDADGNPVAGAKVGFNHDDDPTAVKWPQDHEFGWIEVSTDEAGRWRINRMADELIRRIRGGAKHPEYVDSAYLSLSRDPAAEAKLRAEKYVFQLGRPVSVSGVVVDSDGFPVAEADVLVGGRSMSNKRTAKTSPDGSFTVKGCPPGKQLVSADAPGYATTTIEVAEAGREPLRLVLERGKLLRLRIVNQANQPVPNAYVWLDTIRSGPSDQPSAIPVQADFSPRSDQEGLVVWSNAPNTELQFDIAASGCMRTNEFKVRPDGAEHVVVLRPAVVVSGQVTDADTGKAIPQFRIVCGWPNANGVGGATIQWSSFERDWLNFTGGKYRHAFEDAMIYGGANPGYALKFEAKGYASFISRTISADEGAVQLDVALKPAVTENYTVLLPDGRPAANAEIGLIAPGVRLELAPGRFNRDQLQVGGSMLTADKEGQFQLSADASVHTVMIVHPLGFLRLKRAELTGQKYLQLQPWGRLEGMITSGGKPLPGKVFGLEFADIKPGDLWFGYTAYHVTSDQEGKFSFAQVPPGKLKLNRVIPMHISPTSGGWSDRLEQEVEIRPGETTQVTVGGEGYTVTARVRWPAGFDRSQLHQLMGSVHTPPPAWMMEMAKDPQQAALMAKSPEVLEFRRNVREFQMALDPNGTLSADDVPSGEFELSVFAMLGGNTGGTNMSALMGRARITVPADPATGTLDAGEIALTKP